MNTSGWKLGGVVLICFAAAAAWVLAQSVPTAKDQTIPVVDLEPKGLGGTYWSLQRGEKYPPLPYNPFPELPVETLDEKNRIFLIDDRTVDYIALQAYVEKLMAYRRLEPIYGAETAEAIVLSALDLGGLLRTLEGDSFATMAYPAGSFLLGITEVTTNASLILRSTSSEKLYSILSAPNLTNSTWQMEQVLRGAEGQDWTETGVPVLDRTNQLYFRGMIWPGNDDYSGGLTVSLTNPTNGAFFAQWPTNIPMGATASTTNGTLLGVAFYSGTNLLGWDQSSPYSNYWSNVGRGRYALRARAFDSTGASRTSDPVEISVDPCYDAVNVMLVIDRSGSMAGIKFNYAKQACSNFVGFLTLPPDQAGLVSFDSNSFVNVSLTSSSNAVLAGISNLTTGSGTWMSNAIHLARTELTSAQNTNALRTMVLLSDGQPDDPDAALAEAGRAKSEDRIRIFTIGIGDAVRSFMESLASSTNDYFYSTNGTDLDSLFAAVATRLCRSNAAPTVYLSCPTNNARLLVGDPITLQAYAADPDGVVTRVQFWETNLLGSVQSASNSYFTFLWSDPSHLGTNTLSAVATDNFGLSRTSAPVNFRLIAPPEVEMRSPSNSSAYALGSQISMSAEASQTDGATVTNVEFRAGSILVANVTSATSNLFSTVWASPPPGAYPLTAIAYDSDGLRATSAPVQVSISLNVVLSQPASNSVFVAPAAIPMLAEVSPATGIRYVQFLTNLVTTELGRDSLSVTNPYQFTWVGVPAGDYFLYARVANEAGGIGNSVPVPVKVVQKVAVDPGTHRTLVLTNGSVSLGLNGQITGGHGTITSLWERASGPVLAGITNATSTNAWVAFTNAGIYQLRLAAGDGHSYDSWWITISVVSNQAPVVSAGPNLVIHETNTPVVLRGSASDDGLPTTPLWVGWQVISPANAQVPFTNSTLAITEASGFPSNGIYTLRLAAYDGLVTNHSDMTVTVAPVGSRTYTFNADFAEGNLVNLTYDDVPDQLQLTREITSFPYVAVACSGRGTVVRIDAHTGRVLGEYRSSPQGSGTGSPSRTTVDRCGNIWVANREGSPGSITRIGLVIGGTRGRLEYSTNFVEDATGEYLRPPFAYSTAVDRDGDGYIRTSRGLGKYLAWDPDRTGTNDYGGVSLAEDECIINYTRVACTGTRTLAVDANNDLWVGGWVNKVHLKVSGVTGLVISNTAFTATNGGYGGLIDGQGVLWSSDSLMRFDPKRRFDLTTVTPTITNISYVGEVLTNNYGVGIDPQTGNIWYSVQADNMGVFAPGEPPTQVGYYTEGVKSSKGIAVDRKGNVWVAHGEGTTTIGHFLTDGTFVGDVDLGCTNESPSGVAIDAFGKVWATCRGWSQGGRYVDGAVVRINPTGGPIGTAGHPVGELDLVVNLTAVTPDSGGLLDNGPDPYNYSDMTGFVSLGATARSGVWTVVHDGQTNNTPWGSVSWHASTPAGTAIKVEARASNKQPELTATNNPFRAVTNGLPLTGIAGKYIQVQVTLTRNDGSTNMPALHDLSISLGTNVVEVISANYCQDDRASTSPETPVLIDVLANDAAPANGLVISMVSVPRHGFAGVVTNGANAQLISYTPEPGFSGTDRFTYTARDEQSLGRGLVTVTVGRLAPVVYSTNLIAFLAVNDTNFVPGYALDHPILVLTNDVDPNGSPLAISSYSQAAHGVVRLKSCGLFYTPNPGYYGDDVFTYTVANTQHLSTAAQVLLHVTGAPQPIGCGSNIANVLALTNVAFSQFVNNSVPRHCHTYQFAGDPSKLVQFTWESGPTVNLFDPEGNEITNITSGFIARSTNLHTLEVTTGSLWNNDYPYELSMSCSPTNVPQIAVFWSTNFVPDGGTLVFPVTQVGVPRSTELTITNLGTTNLVFDSVAVDPGNGPFVLDSPLTNNGPYVLAPGAGTNLPVRFLAVEAGQTNGQVHIPSNDCDKPSWYINLLAQANPSNSAPPVVHLTAPLDGAQVAFPSDVPISATASCSATSSLWGINFLTTSPTGSVLIGQALAPNNATNFTGSMVWTRPPGGTHAIFAMAYDQTGLVGQSTNRVISVRDGSSSSTNAPPIAREDTLMVQGVVSNSVTFAIEVLANDSDPNGDELTVTGFTHSGQLGRIDREGNRLLFTLYPLWCGTNYAYYTISDGKGGASGNIVNIFVRQANLPSVELVTPRNGEYIELQTTNVGARSMVLSAHAVSTNPTGTIARVSYFDQDRLLGWTTNSVSNFFTFTWLTPAAGEHYITAVALDDVGQENLSDVAYIQIAGKPGNVVPTAQITNLVAIVTNDLKSAVYPIITTGRIDVLGEASDTDDTNLWSQVLLYKADGTFVANLTPNAGSNGYRTGGDVGGDLVTNVDLTLHENGVYDVVLNVFDGWDVSSDTARILLDTQLKIGQFSFSVEDLTVPVGGMPLTVVRTYNSFNLGQGDFGYSWTYAINGVHVEFDELRQDTPEISASEGDGGIFSLRVGGGRNVTLNLPDGRRTTFQFYLDGPFNCGMGNDKYCYYAKWQAPPGVFAKLTPINGELVYNALTKKWTADSMSGFENFEIQGYVLEMQDGTKYVIEREERGAYFFLSGYNDDSYAQTYGKAYLAKVIQPDGNSIVVEPDRIQHFDPSNQPTRALNFERDEQGRIKAIYDPISDASTPRRPALKYSYDPVTGNLTGVEKLRDRATGDYDLTTYEYTNRFFPHYLTGIIDPRGVQVARTEYGDDGRIRAVIDADGRTNRFYHNLEGKVEITVDRLGRTNSFAYDLRGNVTASTNAVGAVQLTVYDPSTNLELAQTNLGGPFPVWRTNAYDSAGFLVKTVEELRTNSFVYSTNGNLLSQTDGLDNVTSNRFDQYGNLTNIMRLDRWETKFDESFFIYQNGKLVRTLDRNLRTNSSFGYGAMGNLTSATDANGVTRTFGYDENGSQTSSSYTWGQGTFTATTEFDGAGRAIRTVDVNTNETHTFYNSAGKVAHSVDAFGNTNSFVYDARGNLIESASPQGMFTRTVYNEDARPVITTDRNEVTGTLTEYDPAGRVTNTVRLKNVVVGIVPDPRNPGQWRSDLVSLGIGYSTNSTEYYANGWVKSRTGPDGHTTRYDYWPDGQVKSVTDPLTNVTFFAYDAGGRQEYVTNASQQVTEFKFDALGRQIKTIFFNTTWTSNIFNEVGQRVGEVDQAGTVRLFAYNLAGQLTAVTNATVLDPENNNESVNPVWQYGYDGYGRLVHVTDAKNRATTNTFDFAGRLVSRSVPVCGTETNLYNSKGLLWKKVDFKGQIVEFAYDNYGRAKGKFYFAANAVAPSNSVGYEYNHLGQLWRITERFGTNATEGYVASVGPGGRIGPRNRLLASLDLVPARIWGSMTAIPMLALVLLLIPRPVRRQVIEAVAVALRAHARDVETVRKLRLPSLSWRAVTLLVVVALIGSDPRLERLWTIQAQTIPSTDLPPPPRVTEFQYDLDGRLIQVSSPEGVVNYGYHPATGRHSKTWTENSATEYSFDVLGRLETVRAVKRNGDAVSEETRYTYTKVGSRETVTLPNGVVTAYEYDCLNRLTNLTHKLGGTNLLASYTYGLHATGRRTNGVEVIWNPDVNGFVTNTLHWTFDGMYRLAREVSTSTLPSGCFTNSFAYDKVGNRLQQTRVAGGTTNLTIYGYNDADQLTNEVSSVNGNPTSTNAYTYDLNGSLVARVSGGSTIVYAYNLANKLRYVAANGATNSFVYNDSGIRVRSAGSGGKTFYLVDANNHTGYAQVLEEATTQGGAPTRCYVIGDDVLGQGGSGTNSVRWLLYDGHGSTRQLVAPDSSISQQYNFSAYGETTGQSFTPQNLPETSLLYCGEQFDVDLQMYNLRARYFNPASGTFNQPDTFKGDNFDPPSLHRYSYCHLDPVNGVDPSGQVTLIEIMAVGAIIGALVTAVALYATGQPITFGAIVKGAAYGAVFGLAAAIVPAVGIGLGIAGLLSSGLIAYDVLTNPSATLGQKTAAILLIAGSVWGAGKAFKYYKTVRLLEPDAAIAVNQHLLTSPSNAPSEVAGINEHLTKLQDNLSPDVPEPFAHRAMAPQRAMLQRFAEGARDSRTLSWARHELTEIKITETLMQKGNMDFATAQQYAHGRVLAYEYATGTSDSARYSPDVWSEYRDVLWSLKDVQQASQTGNSGN